MTGATPLAALTVVEISTSVAGPVAGHILGDLGATVIKVEVPETGDDARSWGPPFDEGAAPVFHTLNRNKRSVTVDFKNARHCAALRGFIHDQADIVLQNIRPGLVAKYGFDAATLRADRPDLIYCNLTAFGASGPLQMRPGYDPLMQACAGIMSVTGHADADPVRVGPSIVDQGAGMWSVIGILAALHARAATGVGAVVDTSLYETAIAWVPAQIATMNASGRVPGRIGTENAGMAPYRAYQAADGWIVIAAANNNLFARLCQALGRPEWLTDPRFASNKDRVINRIALNQTVADCVIAHRVDWIQQALDAVGVPNAPVKSLDQVVRDPQFEALGILQPVADGGRPLIGLPISFDGSRPPLRTSSPRLGEANALLGITGGDDA
jgi:crotonobetainyl-CoA:carnitine CoA-transferase CaiB-like acyl-CoA transferase